MNDALMVSISDRVQNRPKHCIDSSWLACNCSKLAVKRMVIRRHCVPVGRGHQGCAGHLDDVRMIQLGKAPHLTLESCDTVGIVVVEVFDRDCTLVMQAFSHPHFSKAT